MDHGPPATVHPGTTLTIRSENHGHTKRGVHQTRDAPADPERLRTMGVQPVGARLDKCVGPLVAGG